MLRYSPTYCMWILLWCFGPNQSLPSLLETPYFEQRMDPSEPCVGHVSLRHCLSCPIHHFKLQPSSFAELNSLAFWSSELMVMVYLFFHDHPPYLDYDRLSKTLTSVVTVRRKSFKGCRRCGVHTATTMWRTRRFANFRVLQQTLGAWSSTLRSYLPWPWGNAWYL